MSNVNDERDAADVATVNERNIIDLDKVEDSNEVREAMTEALEDVESIMREMDESGCVSCERNEAEHTDSVMEEISNAYQSRSLSLIDAANDFSKSEAAAVDLSLPGASSNLLKARQIIFEAFKPRRKQKLTSLTGFFS